MKYFDDKYRVIMVHEGYSICTLKVAIPSEGDELGYKVDHKLLKENVYSCLSDAIEAIDLFSGGDYGENKHRW